MKHDASHFLSLSFSLFLSLSLSLSVTRCCSTDTALTPSFPEKAQVFYSRANGQGQQGRPHGEDRLLLGLIDTVNPKLWGMQLGLKLLLEQSKGEQSYFAPYIRSLPSQYGTMPSFFSASDLAELHFPDIQRQAAGRMAQLDLLGRECTRIQGREEDPFKGKVMSKTAKTQLIWATCSVSSRAYRVRGNVGQRGGHLASMLPVIDLINHSFEANCVLQAAEGAGPGAVAVAAATDIACGDALRTNYGEIGNAQLLLNYGFVLDNNPYDVLTLPIGALSYVIAQVQQVQQDCESEQHPQATNAPGMADNVAEELATQQLRLLLEAGASELECLTLDASGELDASSMALVRVLIMRSPRETASCTSALHVQEDSVEQRAREVIRRLCLLALEVSDQSLTLRSHTFLSPLSLTPFLRERRKAIEPVRPRVVAPYMYIYIHTHMCVYVHEYTYTVLSRLACLLWCG